MARDLDLNITADIDIETLEAVADLEDLLIGECDLPDADVAAWLAEGWHETRASAVAAGVAEFHADARVAK